MSELSIPTEGLVLSGEQHGEGEAVVFLHGLTATRRYVVMGSRLLERSGYEVIAYDARGHGRSQPAPERAYGYEHLCEDLRATLDAAGAPRALLVGASMGAHTALAFALAHPERVSALALITPGYEPDSPRLSTELAHWDALAEGLRGGGIDGFVQANDLAALPDAWRATVETVLRQRMAAHEHLDAVAEALEVVPRSHPFASMAQLSEIQIPTVVIGSRDEADPGHPLAVAESYVRAIPEARMVVEEEGEPPRSPIAWQGGQLSKVIIALAERVAANS